MGRTRAKKRLHTTRTEAPNPKGDDVPSISALIEKTKSLLNESNYELAAKFAKRILERSPDHVEGRELLGLIELESGNIKEASEIFQSLIPPSQSAPNPPPASAYLYLAQLSEDPLVALERYQCAVNLLSTRLKGKGPSNGLGASEETEEDIKKNLVRVLVAMVEIWMAPTYDLCFDPKAEENCEALLRTAFVADPNNPEAFLCMSSLRLSQQRPKEARECAMNVWSTWCALDPDDEQYPPIPNRIELTKRLLELSEYTSSLQVLQSIMASDDQEVEAWYLEGWCLYLMAEQCKETGEKIDDLTWEDLAKDSRSCLESCRLLHINQEHPDEEILKHVTELIAQLDLVGITSSNADEGASDDEEGGDDWEDEDDDDPDIEMS